MMNLTYSKADDYLIPDLITDNMADTAPLDKSRLSVRLQPPYSEERRRKASENAKQNGFASQTE